MTSLSFFGQKAGPLVPCEAATTEVPASGTAGVISAGPKLDDDDSSVDSDLVKLFFCGDVMTGRAIDQILPHPDRPRICERYATSASAYLTLAQKAHGPIAKPVGFAYIWGDALTELALRSPDLRIINLETSITKNETCTDKGISYRMSPDNIPCLTAAGVDRCVLANNHVLDWGRAGLLDTLDTLRSAKIKSVGAGLPCVNSLSRFYSTPTSGSIEPGMFSGQFSSAMRYGTAFAGDVMPEVTMMVNGGSVGGEVEGRTLLVAFLRQHLGLTGTHVCCDTSQCGACVVHLDGRSIKSCTLLALQAAERNVTTIEGLAKDGELHPLQAAFREHHGLQCGFCTPGMVMSALDLLKRSPDPSEPEIRSWLEGNLCRCTGYHNIIKAIRAAAQAIGR